MTGGPSASDGTRGFPRVAPGDRCPCLSGTTYGECCRPFHTGHQHAPTAERLMRSRYSAFVVGDAAYLLATWHPSTRPAGTLELDPAQRWYRLDILGRSGGGMLDRTGTVEFVARYRVAAAPAQPTAPAALGPAAPAAPTTKGELHETSTFEKLGGRWFYLAG